jgi:gamma-glutamyl-gamma-aminobutyrate hydrolase PuuD
MSSNPVTVEAGSALASILGPGTVGLCHHHQAVDRLGGRLRAVGFAGDGTVEAVELPGPRFALGVQWHPEDDPTDNRLFVALVAAAAQYRQSRTSPRWAGAGAQAMT